MKAEASYRILVLEDDNALRAVMRDFLSLMNYQVMEAADLASFELQNQQQEFDLLLLDLNLPDGDGLALLKKLKKEKNVPVFVVSGRCDEDSRLQALETGADDYIVKPFNARELEFRIRNFFRRQQSNSSLEGASQDDLGQWHLFPKQYRVSGPNGAIASLTRSECDLLQRLLEANGSLCSRRQLAHAISSATDSANEETITVLIYRLRKKLEAVGIVGPVIETVAGAGYRLASLPRG